MRGKILQTQVLIFENDGRIDLDLCELDVYEIIMQNVGADGVTLFPDGFAPLGGVGLGSKSPNGLRFSRPVSATQTGPILRLFSGTKYPRADRYDVIFDTTASPRRFIVFLYGVQKGL
jgi:hypothetical protein